MIQNIPLGDLRNKDGIIWQMLSFNHKLQEKESKYKKSIYFQKTSYWFSKNKIK